MVASSPVLDDALMVLGDLSTIDHGCHRPFELARALPFTPVEFA